MRITVFTSNQPRHIALVEGLCSVADDVFAIHECNTVLPGVVGDFYRASPVMRDYFERVRQAEREVFGDVRLLPARARTMALRMGDLSHLSMRSLGPALAADVFVVFGASFITAPLVEFLIERRAVNVHMGMSPYYRGAACNFWALYDGRPDLVGATIHRLDSGLDSGAMLQHALPAAAAADPFLLGMLAVRAGHEALLALVRDGTLDALEPVAQDRSLRLRYSTNAEFTDDVARQYLERSLSPESIADALAQRDLSQFLRPFTSSTHIR